MSPVDVMDKCVKDLVENNPGMTVEKLREIVDTLLNIVQRASTRPEEWPNRVLRIRNKMFQEKVMNVSGAWLCLRAVGYRIIQRKDLPEEAKEFLGEMQKQIPQADRQPVDPEELFLFLEVGSARAIFSKDAIHAHKNPHSGDFDWPAKLAQLLRAFFLHCIVPCERYEILVDKSILRCQFHSPLSLMVGRFERNLCK